MEINIFDMSKKFSWSSILLVGSYFAGPLQMHCGDGQTKTTKKEWDVDISNELFSFKGLTSL